MRFPVKGKPWSKKDASQSRCLKFGYFIVPTDPILRLVLMSPRYSNIDTLCRKALL